MPVAAARGCVLFAASGNSQDRGGAWLTPQWLDSLQYFDASVFVSQRAASGFADQGGAALTPCRLVVEVGRPMSCPHSYDAAGHSRPRLLGGEALEMCSGTENGRPAAENRRRRFTSKARPVDLKKSAPRMVRSTAARTKVCEPNFLPANTTGRETVPQAGMREPLATERSDDSVAEVEVGVTDTCAPESTRKKTPDTESAT